MHLVTYAQILDIPAISYTLTRFLNTINMRYIVVQSILYSDGAKYEYDSIKFYI